MPSADELIVAWPDEIDVDAETALVSLVHEERLDIPALTPRRRGRRVLRRARSGSTRAQEKRREKLGDARRLACAGPVGLDLGGETPAEIALEILAEVLSAHKQRRAAPG